MPGQETTTRRKIQVRDVEEGGRLKGHRLMPFSEGSIEVFVRSDADDIELKNRSHHLTLE